jgi:hypothetical protein
MEWLGRFLDWRSDLLDSLTGVTTLHISLLQTHTDTLTLTLSSVHRQVFTSRCSVALPTVDFPFLLCFRTMPVLEPPTSNGNNSQRLNGSSSLIDWLTNSATRQPTLFTNCTAYNISTRTAERTSFLCCCIQLLPWRHACLRSHYLVTVPVDFLFAVLAQQRVVHATIFQNENNEIKLSS